MIINKRGHRSEIESCWKFKYILNSAKLLQKNDIKTKKARYCLFKNVIEVGIKNAFKLGSPGSNTSDVNEVKYNSVPVYL